MVTGWFAWTCLMLAANGTSDVIPMNQRNFQIPISIKPERQADVKELILYRSRDQGKTWEVLSRATRDKKAFEVYGDSDGPMWFSIAVVDLNNRQEPRDVYLAPVGQKLLIDTVRPDVRILSAERVGEEIQIRWEMRDANPDWGSLRLEYWVGDTTSGQPVPLPISPGPQGQQSFKPGLPGPVTIQLQLRDVAGNEGLDRKVVPALGGGTVTDRSVVSMSGFEGTSAMRADSTVLRPTPGAGMGSVPPPPVPPANPAGGPATLAPISPSPSPSPAFGSDPGSSSVAKTEPSSFGATGSVATGGAGSQRLGALPPLKIVNKRQVKLDFEVAEFGPSGLGSVEVYVTTDEGATWEKGQTETGTNLPISGETKNSVPVLGSVMVQLPKDAITYGFYLVVKSRAGLGGPPPRSGDTPQIRLELDTAPPNAELYAPTADPKPTGADTLVLSWKAEDRNLATNPITLEWSAQANGPWEFIGDAQLPNTGRFAWQVPAKIPPRVFLKLSVRDVAGNTAVAQTPEAVLIDLRVPVVRNVQMSAEKR